MTAVGLFSPKRLSVPLLRDPNQTPQPSTLTTVVVDVAEGAGKMIRLEVAWDRCMTDDTGCRDNDGRQVQSNGSVRTSLVRFAAIGALRAGLVWYDHLGLTLSWVVVRKGNDESLEVENEQNQGPWGVVESTAVLIVLSDPGCDNSLVLEVAVVKVAGKRVEVGSVCLDMIGKQGW